MPLTSTYAVRGSVPGRRRRPLCVRAHRAWSTDGGGKPTDGGGGSGYADRAPGFLPLTWHFRIPVAAVIPFVTGFGLGPCVLDTESIGDPVVRGISMRVDAVRVNLQQADEEEAPPTFTTLLPSATRSASADPATTSGLCPPTGMCSSPEASASRRSSR